MTNEQKINAWFQRFEHRMHVEVPTIIAETGIKFIKERFVNADWDGVPWKPYKNKKQEPKRGSLMRRSPAGLMQSVNASIVTPQKVRLSAGGNRWPYARIHNEGGIISRNSRSETFVRNRHTTGKKSKYFGGMGAFKGGTTPGRGLTFKSYTITIPKRQYMGHSAIQNKLIIQRIKARFNEK